MKREPSGYPWLWSPTLLTFISILYLIISVNFFFNHMCESTCNTLPSSAANQGLPKLYYHPWLAADEGRVSHVLSHVVWWKKKKNKLIIIIIKLICWYTKYNYYSSLVLAYNTYCYLCLFSHFHFLLSSHINLKKRIFAQNY